MAITYDIGDVARLGATFLVSDVATDPSTIALTVTSPSLVTTTYTYAGGQVSKISTGVYRYDLAITESGTYQFRWVGTGSAAGAEQDSLAVRPKNTG